MTPPLLFLALWLIAGLVVALGVGRWFQEMKEV